MSSWPLCASVDRDALLSVLLKRELDRLPKGEPLHPVHIKEAQGKADQFPVTGPRPSHAEFARGAVVFRINLGAQSKAEPGWLLPLICRRGGVTRQDVGAIRIGPRHSDFEIAGRAVEDFSLSASRSDPRAPHVRIERVSSESRTAIRPAAHPAREGAGHERPRVAHRPAGEDRPEKASSRAHAGEARPAKVHRMPGREQRSSAPAARTPAQPHKPAYEHHQPAHEHRAPKPVHHKAQAHAGAGPRGPKSHAGNTGGHHPFRGRTQAHVGKKR